MASCRAHHQALDLENVPLAADLDAQHTWAPAPQGQDRQVRPRGWRGRGRPRSPEASPRARRCPSRRRRAGLRSQALYGVPEHDAVVARAPAPARGARSAACSAPSPGRGARRGRAGRGAAARRPPARRRRSRRPRRHGSSDLDLLVQVPPAEARPVDQRQEVRQRPLRPAHARRQRRAGGGSASACRRRRRRRPGAPTACGGSTRRRRPRAGSCAGP